jgi:hypothetical protein
MAMIPKHAATYAHRVVQSFHHSSSAVRCRMRGRKATTNFPMSDYVEELAAAENGQLGDQEGGLYQRHRSKASTYHGVCLSSGKFVAQITVDNQHHHLGVFGTEEEAAQAYDRQGE